MFVLLFFFAMMNNLVSSLVCINLPIYAYHVTWFLSLKEISAKACLGTTMVSALSLLCVTIVCEMFCVCVMFIKFHISCRLQTNQLLKHANYYNKLLISSLMINDSNNG